MRRSLLAVALTAALTVPASAADAEVVANSIVRTYADYCDPRAIGGSGDVGTSDPAIAQNYARVLITKYLSNCERFLTGEVLAAMAVPDLLRQVPTLRSDARRTLTQSQALLLGGAKRLREHWSSGCPSVNAEGTDTSALATAIETWADQLTDADLWDYANGYVGFDVYARQLARVPSSGVVARPCDYVYFLPLGMLQYAINVGLQPQLDAFFNKDGAPMSSNETGAVVDTDRPADQQPWPEVASTFPEEEPSVWEPGMPNTRSGLDEEPIDLNSDVASTDVSAIANFAGRWRSSCYAEPAAEEFYIGQFNLSDPTRFGVGVPRILSSTLSCEVGQFENIEDGVSFTGYCHRTGQAWRGTGSIVWFTDENIKLFLFDDLIPTTLEGCDLPPVVEEEPIDIGMGN